VADFVTPAGGGAGAVRQAIEDLLEREGLWEELVEKLARPPQESA
jgi:3-deoxy-D-manno-octulosonate 8-phosphate phosphatase KdsC-like HAD superfamily phosphatase